MTVSWPAPPTAAQIISVTAAPSTPSAIYTTGSATGSGASSGGCSTVVDQYWVTLLPQYYGPNAKDPDNGQGHADMPNRITELVAKLTGITGIADCSSEVHALQAGAYIAYLYVTSSSNMPPVPEFWANGPNADNDSHYFMTGLIAGRMARKLDDATPDLKTLLGIFAAGGISVGAVVKFILPLVGIAV